MSSERGRGGVAVAPGPLHQPFLQPSQLLFELVDGEVEGGALVAGRRLDPNRVALGAGGDLDPVAARDPRVPPLGELDVGVGPVAEDAAGVADLLLGGEPDRLAHLHVLTVHLNVQRGPSFDAGGSRCPPGGTCTGEDQKDADGTGHSRAGRVERGFGRSWRAGRVDLESPDPITPPPGSSRPQASPPPGCYSAPWRRGRGGRPVHRAAAAASSVVPEVATSSTSTQPGSGAASRRKAGVERRSSPRPA